MGHEVAPKVLRVARVRAPAVGTRHPVVLVPTDVVVLGEVNATVGLRVREGRVAAGQRTLGVREGVRPVDRVPIVRERLEAERNRDGLDRRWSCGAALNRWKSSARPGGRRLEWLDGAGRVDCRIEWRRLRMNPRFHCGVLFLCARLVVQVRGDVHELKAGSLGRRSIVEQLIIC